MRHLARTSRFIAILAMALAVAACAHAQDDDDAPGKLSSLIATADFNHDGIPDMAEATTPAKGQTGPSILTLSLGLPNGSFQPTAIKLVLDHTPHCIVTGDFNHDGTPDLIIGSEDGTVQLVLGDGNGGLSPARTIAHLDSVVSIAVADLNHDGIPDLAITDWRASNVTVLLGNGTGAFHPTFSAPLRMGGTTPHLAIADFNGDGIPDLAVVYDEDDGDTYDVLLGNGTGVFTPAPNLGYARDPNSHCVT
ncbi:FG-GAP repeat domain-containing protein [Granulicella arctica]|uniref:VCBS repeat-containing protein n=1 Tax=Granulicella arctica TaxID=940613 RepID=A0A7Y9PF36_9BACT|nr:VCBS repeat-containing protein [Granulicella arctica]NYF78510.1 hypothetical protein [Granulicella arctica]